MYFQALQCNDGCGDHADISSDDQNDVSWSEEDKQIIIPSVALIKASSACMKRVLGAVRKNGKCECPKDASQLDNLAERLNEVSPAVDEVVLGVYPPINKEVVRENVSHHHSCPSPSRMSNHALPMPGTSDGLGRAGIVHHGADQ